MTVNNSPEPNNKFWTINFGHVLTLVSMVVVAVAGFVKFEGRISGVEYNQASITNGLRDVTSRVEHMDSMGTNASQRGILKDAEQVSSNTRRIEGLERSIGDIVPKLERVSANTEWLVRKVQEGSFKPQSYTGRQPKPGS